jgi:hypothetical protein
VFSPLYDAQEPHARPKGKPHEPISDSVRFLPGFSWGPKIEACALTIRTLLFDARIIFKVIISFVVYLPGYTYYVMSFKLNAFEEQQKLHCTVLLHVSRFTSAKSHICP